MRVFLYPNQPKFPGHLRYFAQMYVCMHAGECILYICQDQILKASYDNQLANFVLSNLYIAFLILETSYGILLMICDKIVTELVVSLEMS